jgi:hypothetical protein
MTGALFCLQSGVISLKSWRHARQNASPKMALKVTLRDYHESGVTHATEQN